MQHNNEGWAWFDTGTGPPRAVVDNLPPGADLPALAARCFRGSDGKCLLAYLRKITIERCLAPGAPDALIRHLEGQRQLVKYIETLVGDGIAGRKSDAREQTLETKEPKSWTI